MFVMDATKTGEVLAAGEFNGIMTKVVEGM